MGHKFFNIMDTLVSLNEIALLPAVISEVRHRGDVNPFYGDKLPIFVAPMTCIINKRNWDKFYNSKIIPIYPIKYNDTFRLSEEIADDGWRSMTLDEFKYYFCHCAARHGKEYHILIDCANGHMQELFDCVKEAKRNYPDELIVMTGNIAHPWTYYECCKARIDYVRVGIGGNINCETGSKTGIHVSLPYLLTEMQAIKNSLTDLRKDNFFTKIIADGGVNTIAKAMKCLALGADYVMMGTMIAKCEEACGKTRPEHYIGDLDEDDDRVVPMLRHYYGQASSFGQFDRFGVSKDYVEGSDAWIPIEYTLDWFCREFENVLRSMMSYTGKFNLSDLVGNVEWRIQSLAEYKSFNK